MSQLFHMSTWHCPELIKHRDNFAKIVVTSDIRDSVLTYSHCQKIRVKSGPGNSLLKYTCKLFVLPITYYSDDNIKIYEMAGACSKAGKEKCIKRFNRET
jgi:hypothetical protein